MKIISMKIIFLQFLKNYKLLTFENKSKYSVILNYTVVEQQIVVILCQFVIICN